MKKLALASFAIVSGVIGGACADRLGDIDTTKPNVVSKDSLQGEWYFRQMVTDIQTLAAYDSDAIIGYSSPMLRVRWEIQEDHLIAISLDEFKPGANDAGEGRELEELIVAKFAIESHFDVRRQYNQQTGEENNVLYEDTSTNKWYDRKSMRVSWQNNTATTFLLDTFKWSSAQQVEKGGGNEDDQKYLLDITSDRINLTTEYDTNVADFLASRVKVFTSAIKIEKDANYQAWDYPAQIKQKDAAGHVITDENNDPVWVDLFERYGFFQSVRQENDRYDGEVFKTRHYYINRHNIWEKTTNKDGSSIPMVERTLKPILYFVAEDYPEEMLPAAKKIGELWNLGFLKALSDINYPVKADTVAFAVCENPVTNKSPAACKTAGSGTKLFGDLRYNFLKLARPKGTVNPLGFGPSSDDWRTGQTINAWAVTYYSGLNTYAKRALDMVKLYNGLVEADSLEWLEGDYFSGLHSSLHNVFEPGANAQAGAEGQLQAGMSEMKKFAQEKSAQFRNNPELKKELKEIQKNLTKASSGRSILEMAAARDFSHLDGVFQDGDKALFEGFSMGLRAMPDDDEEEAAEDNPQTLLSALRANPAKAALQGFLEEQKRLEKLSKNCVYVEQFSDPTVGFIAARVAQKHPYPAVGTPDREERIRELDEVIVKELRDAIYIGVMLHEVGHNLGLRHNFAGSTDELNYIQPGVSSLPVSNDVFVGDPAHESLGYWDFATRPESQIEHRLEYQYSSIMDYGANFASDLHGLGAYDIAAIRFGYLEHVEAYKSSHPNLVQVPQTATAADVKRAQLAVIQQKAYVPWNPDKVRFDAESGLELMPNAQGQMVYLNRHAFCTDTFADGFDIMCSRWDIGADPFEISQLYAERYKQAYWFMNYRRGMVDGYWSFNPAIIQGTFNRYFWYAARIGILASYISEIYGAEASELIADSPLHQLGAIVLNDVMNTLNTPDSGAYRWAREGQTPVLTGAGRDATVELSNTDNSHPSYSKYGEGQEEWSEVSRYGYFNNKIGVLFALYLGFGLNLEQYAQGELAVGLSTLSLANAFKAETAALLKDVLLDRTGRYAALPLAAQNIAQENGPVAGVMASNRVFMDLGRVLGIPQLTQLEDALIDTFGSYDKVPKVSAGTTGYELQYNLLLSMSFLPNFFDKTWQRYLRINQAGDIFSHELADSSRVEEWVDEDTGAVWEAYRFAPLNTIAGEPVDPSLGAEFLADVKTRLAAFDRQINVGGEGGQRAAMQKRYFLDNVRYKLDLWYNLQSM